MVVFAFFKPGQTHTYNRQSSIVKAVTRICKYNSTGLHTPTQLLPHCTSLWVHVQVPEENATVPSSF